jgi:hypothetical protein
MQRPYLGASGDFAEAGDPRTDPTCEPAPVARLISEATHGILIVDVENDPAS